MSTDQTLAFVQSLASQKPEFIANCKSEVYDYIQRQQRRECVAIVEKDDSGATLCRHRPSSDDYLEVLVRFCCRKSFNGHELDSALSEPVVAIVCDCYARLIQRNAAEVERCLRQAIMQDRLVLQETVKLAGGKLAGMGLGKLQGAIAHLAHELVARVAHEAASSQLGAQVGHGVVAIAGTTAGQVMAKMLVKAVATHCHGILVQVASSALVKKMVLVAAKKFILVGVTAFIVQALAAKFGIAATASVVPVIGWAALGIFMLAKLDGLPQEMAEKVSSGVGDMLADNYTDCVTDIFNGIKAAALDPEKLAEAMVEEMAEFKDLEKYVESGIDVNDPGFCELGKLNTETGKVVSRAKGIYGLKWPC
ncbi:hypothetical protein NEMBOFW57_009036 [Staphylotrichum longicolle]|uniref:Uncharacterized protein n=1 Tax=Staphylotrichum longicolle TaxID=669026 RepID=A0AAD4ESG9_9PEZI|nr:hypothetical protein NEMBOFW57_009036 [Staphylotrichum longicolle]